MVSGKQAPALTVASLATTITRRPWTEPITVTHARGWRPAPLLVHLVGGPETKLEHRRARVEQGCDPLAGRLSPLGVLARRWPRARRPVATDPPARESPTSARAAGLVPGS